MKFQTVTFSRLVSGPGYSNQTIGATAILESFDTPETALAQLEQWVNDQFGQREEQGITLRNANHDLYETQVQLNQTRQELEAAQSLVGEAQNGAGAARHGGRATLLSGVYRLYCQKRGEADGAGRDDASND